MPYRMLIRIFIAGCVTCGLVLVIFVYVDHVRSFRMEQARLLVTKAKMIVGIPSFGGPAAPALLALHTPNEAIALCTEAIELWPGCKDAYEVCASVYVKVGETELAKRDRAIAESLEPAWPK